ncbi:MAG: hypothetical protein WBP71_22865 [Terracidiphilus sp.]
MSTPVPRPPAAQRLFADSTVFQWQNQTLRADLIFTLPIAICLAVGLAIHHPGVGLVAAGGAMNTGFGQKHRIDNSQLVPMILVTLGMAFSGFVGVVVGHENLLLVFLSALWAFGYGLLTARPEGYAWVGQQCVITFLVASAFPAPLSAAAARPPAPRGRSGPACRFITPAADLSSTPRSPLQACAPCSRRTGSVSRRAY